MKLFKLKRLGDFNEKYSHIISLAIFFIVSIVMLAYCLWSSCSCSRCNIDFK